jgi:hypothetical protein
MEKEELCNSTVVVSPVQFVGDQLRDSEKLLRNMESRPGLTRGFAKCSVSHFGLMRMICPGVTQS